jgi:hypothetical protein
MDDRKFLEERQQQAAEEREAAAQKRSAEQQRHSSHSPMKVTAAIPGHLPLPEQPMMGPNQNKEPTECPWCGGLHDPHCFSESTKK